jgi:hypothetical protein
MWSSTSSHKTDLIWTNKKELEHMGRLTKPVSSLLLLSSLPSSLAVPSLITTTTQLMLMEMVPMVFGAQPCLVFSSGLADLILTAPSHDLSFIIFFGFLSQR